MKSQKLGYSCLFGRPFLSSPHFLQHFLSAQMGYKGNNNLTMDFCVILFIGLQGHACNFEYAVVGSWVYVYTCRLPCTGHVCIIISHSYMSGWKNRSNCRTAKSYICRCAMFVHVHESRIQGWVRNWIFFFIEAYASKCKALVESTYNYFWNSWSWYPNVKCENLIAVKD